MEARFKIIIIFIVVFSFSKAKGVDSLLVKRKNIVYVLPTAIAGDLLWELENFWIEAGYARKYSKENSKIAKYLDVKLGAIVYSSPTYGGGLVGDINARSSKGYNINIEQKIVFENNFYYSTNIFYQYTSTLRDGERNAETHGLISENNYTVKRNVYCLQPKVGFHLVYPGHFYFDIGLAAGIRYVESHSLGKINTHVNSGYETLVKKEFDKGAAFAQRISFQIKLGYHF